MASARVVVAALALGLVGTTQVGADLAVMTDVTLGFGQALEQCRAESGLTEERMEEFFHFWSEDFKLETRDVGCALRCMSDHYNLLTDAGRMHHENTEKFIRSFPNGDVLSKQLVGMLHECEKIHHAEEDHCFRVLHMAACFRDSCRAGSLAPTMEMLLAEFIMEAEP